MRPNIIGTFLKISKTEFSDNSAIQERGVLMSNNNNAVAKGLAYEEQVTSFLNKYGLDAHRTNVTNPDDPEEYKHGFDGGVDIIARYKSENKVKRDITFYIQCKDHKNELTKSAISEVYAGMHARKNYHDLCIPVVISSTTASQETMQFAKSLGVELILATEWGILHYINKSNHAVYANYGTLMKLIIYNITKNPEWIENFPENGNPLSDAAIREKMIEQSKTDFDSIQADYDEIEMMEMKLREKKQKALDKQKNAVMRVLQACNLSGKSDKKNADKQDEESG